MLGDESFIYIKNVIWYTVEREESTGGREVIEFFSKLFEERKEEVMTIADQLMEQGKMQSIEKGREEVAKNLLLQGLDISIIENATGLSRKNLAKIQKNIRTTH